MAKRKKRPARPKPAVDIVDLTRSYGDLLALAPLHLEVPRGQALGVVGHNGSGKSTLLQLIAGLLEPTEGSVRIEGHEIGSLPARAAVSYIGDSPVLYDDLSVWEHLEYVGGLRAVPDWESWGGEVLRRLALDHRADEVPTGFSRGLRQKTALAVGFLPRAPVLLVDEPFVGLDRAGREALIGLVEEREAAGHTSLLATHELDVLSHLDRCIVLRDGEVVYDGDPAEARDSPSVALD